MRSGALIGLAAALLFLLPLGCAHSSGRGVFATSTYNLEIENTDWGYLDVYVDGGFIGTVAGDEVAYFCLIDGFHTIEVQSAGHFYPAHLGSYYFTEVELISIVY